MTPPGSYTSPSTTPIRSSPLSKPPVFAPDRASSPARPLTLHGHSHPVKHHAHSGPSHRHASQPISSTHRRLSFTPTHPSPLLTSSPQSPHSPGSPRSPHPGSPPLSRSQPLLGSYQLSLLHSRMSRTQSHSVQSTPQSGFSLHISAVGKGKACHPHLRSPAPLHVPFSATYYDLPSSIEGQGGSGSTQTPWVGHVDLERRYFDEYSLYDTPGAGPSRPPPMHPGLEVAAMGQLQILVKSTCAPVKVFIVPYDLRRVPPGGRLLIRERTVVEAKGDANGKRDFLRYAIQLQLSVICDPSLTKASDERATTRARSVGRSPDSDAESETQRPSYFLSRSLKVIFAAQPPESGETMRTERHDEVVLPSSDRRDEQSAASRDWSMLRQKWIARQEMQQAVAHDTTQVATQSPIAPNLLKPRATREASPPRFEKSPIPQRAVLPHIPLLEPIQSADTSRVPSRSATPIQTVLGADLPMMTRERSGRKRRQGSSSIEDKELSEKLRALGLNK